MKKTLVKIGMLSLVMLAGYGLQASESINAGVLSAYNTAKGDTVYQTCDIPAEFPGGLEAMLQFISRTVKYPEAALKNNVTGKVFVSFVIERNGTVSDVEVLKGMGSGLDQEAVRVVKAMPKWKPASHKGKTVRQKFYLPINFSLPDNKK